MLLIHVILKYKGNLIPNQTRNVQSTKRCNSNTIYLRTSMSVVHVLLGFTPFSYFHQIGIWCFFQLSANLWTSIIDIVSLATHRLRHGQILNIEYFLMFSAGRCSEKTVKKIRKNIQNLTSPNRGAAKDIALVPSAWDISNSKYSN